MQLCTSVRLGPSGNMVKVDKRPLQCGVTQGWRKSFRETQLLMNRCLETSRRLQIQNIRVKQIGHILRHNDFVNAIAKGLIEGTHRERPRLSYMHQVMEHVGCQTYAEMKRKARRRAEWSDAAIPTYGFATGEEQIRDY